MSTLALITRVMEFSEEKVQDAIERRLYERGRILPGEPLCSVETIVGEYRTKTDYRFPNFNNQ